MNREGAVLSLAELEAFDPEGGKGGGGEKRWLCPLCGVAKPRDAAHRCLSVSEANGVWKCHRCSESGVLREFWKPRVDVLGLSSRQQEARVRRAHLSRIAELQTPNERLKMAQCGEEQEDWRVAWERASALEATPGAAYLEKRGIALNVAMDSQVRYAADWIVRGQSAVLFPVCARSGEMVAVQGRYIAERPLPKARTAGSLKDGVFCARTRVGARFVGPFDEVSPSIIVTEAPIDALSLAACGFPSLALCGTSLPRWFHLACGLRKVVWATDADEAGDEAAAKHEALLRLYGAHCLRLRPEGAKDWNEDMMQRGVQELSEWLCPKLLV